MSRGKGSTFNDADTIGLNRATSGSRVLGAPTRSGRRSGPPPRIEGDRRCHCGTKLTAYNPGDSCYAHSERKRVRFRPVLRSTSQ